MFGAMPEICAEEPAGRYYVITLNDAISVSPIEAPDLVTPLQGQDAATLQRIIDALPPRSTGGLRLYMRGAADD